MEDPVVKTDTCGHEFCLNCINTWSQNHYTCPKCRQHYFNIINNSENIPVKHVTDIQKEVREATYYFVNRMSLICRLRVLQHKCEQAMEGTAGCRRRNLFFKILAIKVITFLPGFHAA